MGRLSFKRFSTRLKGAAILVGLLLPAVAYAVVHLDVIQTLDGSAGAPSYSFSKDQNTGIYRLGTGDIGTSVAGSLGMEVLKYSTNQINVGIGGAALNSAGKALFAQYTINGAANFQYSNASTGTSASTDFCISGGSATCGINLESHTYQTSGYLAGASLISAGTNNAPLFVIANEFDTSPNISFLLGGREAVNTAMVLSQSGLSFYGSSSGYLTLTVPSAVTTGTLTLPGGVPLAGSTISVASGGVMSYVTNGTSGLFLKSNGTGSAPSWAAANTGLTAPTKQILTSGTSSTYTTPAGANLIKVTVIGGGGGGGGAKSASVSGGAASGGGGGAVCISYLASPSGTYTYTVGGTAAGGSGATPANGTGGNASVFGLITAGGGSGGGASSGFTVVAFPGGPTSGGACSGTEDLSFTGNVGQGGIVLAGTQSQSGNGGSSGLFGGGGIGSSSEAVGGNAGSNSGGGGGGGNVVNGGGNENGGTGAAGLIIVEEFYQ